MAKLNSILLEFASCARALAELLRENQPLSAVDQLLIENHLQAVHLAYSVWKRQHRVSEQDDSRAQDIPVA